MKEDIDSVAVDQSLKKIAKGGGLIFAGTLFSMAFQLINRILIVRSVSVADYGIFSLGLVIFSIVRTVSQGGFSASVPRFLGYYRGKNDEGRIKGVIKSTFTIELSISLIIFVILFFGAGIIEDFFQIEGLSLAVKIFAVGIPLFNFIHVVNTIFRGFDNAHPTLYFHNVMKVGLQFLFLLFVITVAPSLPYILIAYVAAMAVTAVCALGYYVRKSPQLGGEPIPVGKELLLFSLPLFGTVFLGQVMKWTDVIMLGHFTSADLVGLYSAAVPLSGFVPIFLSSTGFIFVPVLSVLYSQGQLSEMKRTYTTITKWTFSATLPLFLVVFVFPRQVLTFLFWIEYQPASTALRILALGYFSHILLGPIVQNLIIFGKPRLIMVNNAAGLLTNVILNALLIPVYGINGAAAATAVTYGVVNVLALLQVYRTSGIHPFSSNYVKPLGSALVLVVIFALLFHYYLTVPFWMLPLVFMVFFVLYCLMILVTKSFDREDIMLLHSLEKRIGVDLTWLEDLLKRFLSQ